MNMEDIISKIKEAGLKGRSGCDFPTADKWRMVKEAVSEKKYVVCNASEGELETFKDHFLLKNHLKEVLEGIEIAKNFLQAEMAYLYLNADYYEEMGAELEGRLDGIKIVKKPKGYIAGEETAILEVIEGREAAPRIKPPFPTTKGLWGLPTLVNNVETFYSVSKICKGEYSYTRFYSIGGEAPNKGVFELPEEMTIDEILKKTENIPPFSYFLQVGGGACGEIMLQGELEKPVSGLASLVIYNKEKTDPFLLMGKWVEFLLYGNCDRCTPCREGIYRLAEMIKERNMSDAGDLFFVMEKSSLCPLGRVAVVPFKSLIEKVLYGNNY